MDPRDVFDPPTGVHAVSLHELARRMKMSVRQLKRWFVAGKLKAFREKSGRLVVSELEAQRVSGDQRCEICGAQKRRLYGDHCHRTGWPRGMLCTNCNSGLGMFRDDETLLERAIEYVRRHRVAADAATKRMSKKEKRALGPDRKEPESTPLDIPCPACSATAGVWCSAPFETYNEGVLNIHNVRVHAWSSK